MKKNTIFNLTKYLIAFFCILSLGCKKFIEIPSPIDQLEKNAVFSDPIKATAAVRGLYASMIGSTIYFPGTRAPYTAGLSITAGVSADELISSLNDFIPFFKNSIPSDNSINSFNSWGPFYNYIFESNVIIENVEGSSKLNDALKKQLTAEAKFLRALNYFYLVNLYGGVPLVVTADYRVNASLKRSSVEEVYDLIISDLQYAHTNLGTNFTEVGKRFRASKFTAAALMARIYLYRSNWVAAETMASEVLNETQLYDLERTDINKTFLITSKEVIFQLLQSNDNLYTYDGQAFITQDGAIPRNAITENLSGTFEANDLRKSNWIKKSTVTTDGVAKDYFYPYKYKLNSGTGGTQTEAMVVLRVGELYLIRAEARAQQGKLTDAIGDLDQIRGRANIFLIAATNPLINQTDLLKVIQHERFVELFTELGHRWFDVKRTGQADIVFKAAKSDWKTQASLFPIPKTDIDANKNLIQNDGY